MNNHRPKQYFEKISKIAIYVVSIYLIFLLGRTFYHNFQLKRGIEKLEGQIVTLEEQKKDLANLNLYYQSDAFKELEARRKLNLKRVDEKVVILPGSPAMPPTSR